MRKESGFTLIELLITMVVAAILVSIAVPSFKLTFQNNRLVAQSNDLLGTMLYARSEAIELNTNVKVCASSDAATCSAGGDWAQGWITSYVDGSGTTQILRVEQALSGSNTLTSTFGANIVFQNSGSITAAGAGTFNICDSRGAASGRSMWVTVTGLPRLSTTAGKKIDGTNMSC
jgi:type IV fimbrial biogenesis protein FimT